MGAATTFTNEPAHIEFQMSQFPADLLASLGGSFYQGPLVPVLERFRAKAVAAWKGFTHVDWQIEGAIPHDVKKFADTRLLHLA